MERRSRFFLVNTFWKRRWMLVGDGTSVFQASMTPRTPSSLVDLTPWICSIMCRPEMGSAAWPSSDLELGSGTERSKVGFAVLRILATNDFLWMLVLLKKVVDKNYLVQQGVALLCAQGLAAHLGGGNSIFSSKSCCRATIALLDKKAGRNQSKSL